MDSLPHRQTFLLSAFCLLLLTSFASARPVPAWTYEKLTQEADLVVIATPTAVRDTDERTTLPNLSKLDSGDSGSFPALGVETTFEISATLKGQADKTTIVFHHLRMAGNYLMIDGPSLISFDPKEQQRFLLFLKREADGRYVSLTGQIDPDTGVKLLGQLPSSPVHPARIQFRLMADDKDDNAEMLRLFGGQGNKVRVNREVLLDETSVSSASAIQFTKSLLMTSISVKFTEAGGKKFSEVTKANVGKRLAIVLFNEVLAEKEITAADTYFSVTIHGSIPGGHDGVGDALTEAIESAAKDKPEPSPIKSSPLPGGDKPLTEEEAARTGAETATKDIETGVFRILYYGKPYTQKPLVDDATDFRVQVVGGCAVTAPFVAKVTAYNNAMRQWQAKHPHNIAKPDPAKPLDVGYGTFEVPEDFTFIPIQGIDSFPGKLVRKGDGFTINFDIGGLAGTHMHQGKKETCTYFRSHTIGGFPALTGIETVAGKRQITTTVTGGTKTDPVPANFSATVEKDADIADFLLIVGSYQPKAK